MYTVGGECECGRLSLCTCLHRPKRKNNLGREGTRQANCSISQIPNSGFILPSCLSTNLTPIWFSCFLASRETEVPPFWPCPDLPLPPLVPLTRCQVFHSKQLRSGTFSQSGYPFSVIMRHGILREGCKTKIQRLKGLRGARFISCLQGLSFPGGKKNQQCSFLALIPTS